MRSGHGGTGDGVGSSVGADPGGENVHTRGEDVEVRAVVGERSTSVVGVNGTDGASSGLGSWGDVAGILVLVTGGDGGEDSSLGGGADGAVGLRAVWASEGHGDDGAADTTAVLGVVDDPVDTGHDVGVVAGTLGVEDLHTDDGSLLGDTVGGGAGGTGAVSSVSVAVSNGLAVNEVGTLDGTATELLVSGVDTLWFV